MRTDFKNIFGGIGMWWSIQADHNAFVFIIRSNASNWECPKFIDIKEDYSEKVAHSNQGPAFCEGHTANITDKCDKLRIWCIWDFIYCIQRWYGNHVGKIYIFSQFIVQNKLQSIITLFVLYTLFLWFSVWSVSVMKL